MSGDTRPTYDSATSRIRFRDRRLGSDSILRFSARWTKVWHRRAIVRATMGRRVCATDVFRSYCTAGWPVAPSTGAGGDKPPPLRAF